MRAVEDDYWWYRALRSEIVSMIRPRKQDFSLLDAGCGSGGMLASLARQFPSAAFVGMDVSEHAVKLTAARLTGASLTTGNVNQLPFPDSCFDYVLSLDVLTNKGVDDRVALCECYRVLRPGGELLVNVAALDFLRGSHDIAVDADRRYTRSRMAALLRKTGFCIQRLTYWNMSLLPIVALVRWRSRKKPATEARSDFAQLPTGFNSVLTNLMQLELRASSVVPLPFGTFSPCTRQETMRPEPQLTLSIVVPLYNSAGTLEMLLSEFAKLSIDGGFELILVNDGSRDETEEIALRLLPRVSIPLIYLSLSRNFGEHNAILAGLRASSGDFVITMDDDLQNPPSEVVKLLAIAQQEQRDVVYSIYEEKQHPGWRNLGSSITNLVANWSIDKPKGLYLSSFRCISRFVVDAISTCATPYPYVDGLIFQITQNVGTVVVRHDPRLVGESGYRLSSLLRLWMSMFINASIIPLQVATVAGLCLSVVGFLAVIEVAVEHFAWHTPLGWGSTMATILLFAGTQLLLLGVMGEDIGRIYLGVSDKPQSVVRRRVTGGELKDAAERV